MHRRRAYARGVLAPLAELLERSGRHEDAARVRAAAMHA